MLIWRLTFHPPYMATHSIPSSSMVIPSGNWKHEHTVLVTPCAADETKPIATVILCLRRKAGSHQCFVFTTTNSHARVAFGASVFWTSKCWNFFLVLWGLRGPPVQPLFHWTHVFLFLFILFKGKIEPWIPNLCIIGSLGKLKYQSTKNQAHSQDFWWWQGGKRVQGARAFPPSNKRHDRQELVTGLLYENWEAFFRWEIIKIKVARDSISCVLKTVRYEIFRDGLKLFKYSVFVLFTTKQNQIYMLSYPKWRVNLQHISPVRYCTTCVVIIKSINSAEGHQNIN